MSLKPWETLQTALQRMVERPRPSRELAEDAVVALRDVLRAELALRGLPAPEEAVTPFRPMLSKPDPITGEQAWQFGVKSVEQPKHAITVHRKDGHWSMECQQHSLAATDGFRGEDGAIECAKLHAAGEDFVLVRLG